MGMSEMAEQTKTSQEPSMEEILSSIRRIIADEDTTEPPAPARAAAPASAPPTSAAVEEDEVLELTQVVEPPRAEQQRPEPPPPPPPPAAARPAAPEWQPRAEPPPRSQPMASEAANSLISPSAANASAQALAKLARVGAADPREAGGGLGELTVEKLLRNLLTPLLKDWLDQNLPAVVERVVEQEVKKLARRAELL